MIFSILVQKYGISHRCNYRLSASTINTPLDGEPDPAAVSRLRQELEANSSMTPKRVNGASAFLKRPSKGEPQADSTAHMEFRTVLQGAIISTLDFTGAWGEHFRLPMRGLLARIL